MSVKLEIEITDKGGSTPTTSQPSPPSPPPAPQPVAPITLPPAPQPAGSLPTGQQIGDALGNGIKAGFEKLYSSMNPATSMYEGMFAALSKGTTKFAGIDDPALRSAKPAFDRGEITSAAELQKWVNANYQSGSKPAGFLPTGGPVGTFPKPIGGVPPDAKPIGGLPLSPQPVPDMGLFETGGIEIANKDWKPAGRLPTGGPVGGMNSSMVKAWMDEATKAKALDDALKARKPAGDAFKTSTEPAGGIPRDVKPAGGPPPLPPDASGVVGGGVPDPRGGKPSGGYGGSGGADPGGTKPAGGYPAWWTAFPVWWAGSAPRGGPAGTTFPPPGGKGPPADTRNVSAFDRPVATIIMGPNPLPVKVVDGGAGGGTPKPKKETEDPSFWAKAGEMVGKSLRMIAGQVGGVGGDIARSDYAGVADKALNVVDKVGEGLGKLGPEFAVAGVAIQGMTAVVRAESEMVKAFIERAHELSPYSGQLAGATAIADVRKMMSDMREADVLGPKLAELVELQSRMEAALNEGLLPVKAFLLDEAITFMKNVRDLGVAILEGINKIPGVDIAENIRKIKALLEGDGDGEAWSFDWERAKDSFRPPREILPHLLFRDRAGREPSEVPLFGGP